MYRIDSSKRYTDAIAVTVATITFTKIGIAIRGLIVARRTHDPLDSSVRFVAFIDAMLSLVVTQDVLLESQGSAHTAQPSGLFGIGLGVLAISIGLWMMLRRRWPEHMTETDMNDIETTAVVCCRSRR